LIVLWRISNHADLQGLGGEKAEGRWHTPSRGKRIVYLSENPATALIETLANLKGNPALFPDAFQLLRIAVPATVSRTAVALSTLSALWKQTPTETQPIGNAWLSQAASALLRVPSAPSPESFNYLFNPLHPDAHLVTIKTAQRITYDQRLFHTWPTT